ncbi:MAG: hypothetical protein K6L76_01160 [Agarilytica sp.]
MWVGLIIVFAIAMVLGPVMLMQPSPGMARIAKLRTQASTLGMAVRLPSPLKNGEKVRGAVYTLPLDPVLQKIDDLPYWSLRRLGHSHGIHFNQKWDWGGKQKALPCMQACLHACIDELPEGIAAIEMNASGLGMQWDERIGEQAPEAAVEALKQRLEALMRSLVETIDEA